MLTLIYYGKITEHGFADRMKKKANEFSVHIDDAICHVIDDLSAEGMTMPDNVDEFWSDAGLIWDIARGKRRERDWQKQQGGLA